MLQVCQTFRTVLRPNAGRKMTLVRLFLHTNKHFKRPTGTQHEIVEFSLRRATRPPPTYNDALRSLYGNAIPPPAAPLGSMQLVKQRAPKYEVCRFVYVVLCFRCTGSGKRSPKARAFVSSGKQIGLGHTKCRAGDRSKAVKGTARN